MANKHFESPWDIAQTWVVISTAPKVSETYPAPFSIWCLHCFQTGIDLAPSALGGEKLVPWVCFSPSLGEGVPLTPVPPAEARAHGQEGDKP